MLGITWRVFRPSGIEEKQWIKLREEAMLQFQKGIPQNLQSPGRQW